MRTTGRYLLLVAITYSGAILAQLDRKPGETAGSLPTLEGQEVVESTGILLQSRPTRSGNRTVYKTVDAKGVVTYSDTPPPQGAEVETLVIDVQAAEPSQGAQDQLEAMRETTDRMVADRQQREQHRAEMRKLQSESRPQAVDDSATAGYDGTYTGYYPYNYPYPVYRPRPGHRPGGGYWPRPEHPIARPPLRPRPPFRIPAEDIISPGYDYPASLIRRSYSPEVRAAFE